MAKRRRRKGSSGIHRFTLQRRFFTVALIGVLALVGTTLGLFFSILFKEEPTVVLTPEPPAEVPAQEKTAKLLEHMSYLIKKHETPDIRWLSEIEDYNREGKKGLLPPPPKEPVYKPKPPITPLPGRVKPMLAIIIDDVASQQQVQRILSLGMPLTISIFPPSKNAPNTDQIAKRLEFYIIHIPLEAQDYPYPEPFTLNVDSSTAQINQRIRQIREWFPKATMMNNHTGSRFTGDDGAMDRLLTAMQRYNFNFIDSRTTGRSVVREVGERHRMKILSRDTFLDNQQEVGYIQSQLKKAVALAKRNGQAIAIGHPHPATLEALRRSASLLKDVEVVYVNELL